MTTTATRPRTTGPRTTGPRTTGPRTTGPTTTRADDAAPTAPAATVLDLLERSRDGLVQACHSALAAERYTEAHLAALRAAAALLAARSAPSGRARPRSVWEVLPAVAPELGEWAVFFAGTGRRRISLERSASGVSPREADDLVRQAETFLELVRAALHLPLAAPLPGELAPIIR